MELICVRSSSTFRSANSSHRGTSGPPTSIIISKMPRKRWKPSKMTASSWSISEMLTLSTETLSWYSASSGRSSCAIRLDAANFHRESSCSRGFRPLCRSAKSQISPPIGIAEFCCRHCWIIVNQVDMRFPFFPTTPRKSHPKNVSNFLTNLLCCRSLSTLEIAWP